MFRDVFGDVWPARRVGTTATPKLIVHVFQKIAMEVGGGPGAGTDKANF